MSLVHTGEEERGCGLRKYKGLYLVCDPGRLLNCGLMPFPLAPCPTCGLSPAEFSRGFQWIRPGYFSQPCKAKCPATGKCAFTAPPRVPCPKCDGEGYVYASALDVIADSLGVESDRRKCLSCRGSGTVLNLVGLMWVGSQYYTPDSFRDEAVRRGVSKRIPANQVPNGLRLGESWVMLATRNAVDCPDCEGEDCPTCEGRRKLSAIFYAFQPTRLEMIVKADDLVGKDGNPSGLAIRLSKQGITPVIARPEDLREETELEEEE